MNKSIKRKKINYSVKTQMQIRLFIKILGISLLCVGVMATIFYFYSNRAINNSYRNFHVHAENFLDYLLPAILLSIIAAVILAAVITLFLPIKYAGPLFRIERDLREKVSEGDMTVRFILRKGDEVGDLADAVNYCIEKLGKKVENIREGFNKMKSYTDETYSRDAELKELVNQIGRDIDQIKTG